MIFNAKECTSPSPPLPTTIKLRWSVGARCGIRVKNAWTKRLNIYKFIKIKTSTSVVVDPGKNNACLFTWRADHCSITESLPEVIQKVRWGTGRPALKTSRETGYSICPLCLSMQQLGSQNKLQDRPRKTKWGLSAYLSVHLSSIGHTEAVSV